MPMGTPQVTSDVQFRNFFTRRLSTFNIRAVHGALNYLFYSHTNGRFYRMDTNNNVEWMASPDGNSSIDYINNNGGRLFSAGATGFAAYSNDNGTTWTKINVIAAQNASPNGMAIKTLTDKILIPFTANKMCASTNNGVTWTEINLAITSTTNANAAFYDSTSNKFFIGCVGGYYTIGGDDDPGIVGNYVFTATVGNNFYCFSRFKGILFAGVSAASGSTVFSSTDNGVTFAAVNPENVYNNLTSNVNPTVMKILNDSLYSIGPSSTIEFTDDGIFWQACPLSIIGANIRSATEFESIIYACYDTTSLITSLTP